MLPEGAEPVAALTASPEEPKQKKGPPDQAAGSSHIGRIRRRCVAVERPQASTGPGTDGRIGAVFREIPSNSPRLAKSSCGRQMTFACRVLSEPGFGLPKPSGGYEPRPIHSSPPS